MYHIENRRIGIYIAFCQLSTEWRTVPATSYNKALNYVGTYTRYDIKLLPIRQHKYKFNFIPLRYLDGHFLSSQL